MGLVGSGFRRRPGRSGMLTLAVAVAVALLVALQSLAAGFFAAQTAEVRDRPVDAILQPLATRGDPQLTGPRAAGIVDSHDLSRDLAARPGVESASPTLEAGIVARASPEGESVLVLAQGVIPGDHASSLTASQREKFDGYFTSAEDPRYANGTYAGPASGEVVINTALASRFNLTRNATLLLAASPTDPPAPRTVVGIFETPYTGTGLLGGVFIALLPLSELQELSGVSERDAATRIALRFAPDVREEEAETERLVASLETEFPGFQVLTRADELAEARERAAVSAGFYTAVAYVSLVVSALFVTSVMVMEVQERKRDLGVLRAIGWSRASVFRTVAADALLFVSLGTALGVLLGWGASEMLGNYFREGYGLDVDFTLFTPGLALASAAQSLLIGVAAALYPAWRASRVDPLSVLRSAR